MTPRLAYALRQSFRLRFGLWLSEAEIGEWVAFLASHGVSINEEKPE